MDLFRRVFPGITVRDTPGVLTNRLLIPRLNFVKNLGRIFEVHVIFNENAYVIFDDLLELSTIRFFQLLGALAHNSDYVVRNLGRALLGLRLQH